MSRSVVCLLAAALLLASCSSPEERLARHIERADAYLAQGDTKSGLLELRSALQIAPGSADVNFRLAEVLRGEGSLDDAMFYYNEATRLDPTHDGAALGLAQIVMFQDADRARTLIQGVLDRHPDSAMGHVRLSELGLVDADTAAALVAALTAIELAPDDPAPRLQLGLVRRAQIRERELRKQPLEEELPRAAIEAFDQTIERVHDPKSDVLDRASVERANVFASWPGHEADAAAAYRKAAEAIEARPVSTDRKEAVLKQALHYGATQNDAELQSWALRQIVTISPDQLNAWSGLANLAGEGKGSAVLEELLAARPDDPNAHALYARRLADEGRAQDALAHLDEVAGKMPEPWALLEAAAEIRLSSGDVPGATRDVERLLREQPNASGTRLASARLAIAEGRVQEAQTMMRQLIGEDANNAVAHQVMAETEARLGQAAAAVASMRKAIELAGGAPPLAWVRDLGRFEVQAQDWSGAVQSFRELYRRQQALEVDDVVRLARALYELDKPEAARKQLENALGFQPTPLAAVMMFARREGRNDPERAQALLEQAIALHPESAAPVRQLVLLELQRKRPDAALARVNAALANRADSAPLELLRARVLATTARLDEARESARRALAIDPKVQGGVTLLGSILVAQARKDEAVDWFEGAVRAGNASIQDRIALAGLHIERDERARAIELLEGVLAERSDLPEVKNNLAFLIAQEGGDLRRALQLAQEARAARSDASQFADTLGYVYLQLGMNEPAIIQLQDAVRLAAEGSTARATANHHLGLALKAAGRNSEANAAFSQALASKQAYPEKEETRRELRALPPADRPGTGSS